MQRMLIFALGAALVSGVGAQTVDDAHEAVTEQVEAWLASDAAQALRERSGQALAQGFATVGVPATDPRWPKFRALAFQSAWQDALANHLALLRRTTTVETMRALFQDAVAPEDLEWRPPESTETYADRVLLKTAVVEEQALDAKLAEQGLGEEEIARLGTPETKRQTLKDSIARTTLTRALGSTAGMVPAKTFEAIDRDGTTQIGVVAWYSQAMRDVADRIARGRAQMPVPERAGAPVRQRVRAIAKEDLTTRFGVRLWRDESGYPVVVGFGQWSARPGGTKRQQQRRRELARAQAQSAAEANLVAFIQANTEITRESVRAGAVEEALVLSPGQVTQEVGGATLIDQVTKRAISQSQVTLTGLEIIRDWRAPHPVASDHEIVGAVAWWSPAREDEVRAMTGQAAKHAPPAAKPAAKPVGHGSGVLQSEEPDLADF